MSVGIRPVGPKKQNCFFKGLHRMCALVMLNSGQKVGCLFQRALRRPKGGFGIHRQVHRVAITNNRIASLKDGKEAFTYWDRRDNNELKEMTLGADEFVRRFILRAAGTIRQNQVFRVSFPSGQS